MKRLIIFLLVLSLNVNSFLQAQTCRPFGEGITDVTKAIALVEHSGYEFTGALVNNDQEDGTYYFLTSSYPFDSQCENGHWQGYNYPDIKFTWVNGQVTYGARIVFNQDEIALLELNDAPPFDEISYLGIKKGGTPNYCLSHWKDFGSPELVKSIVLSSQAGVYVETNCVGIEDEYLFTSSGHSAVKVINWQGNVNLNEDEYAKGSPLLDAQHRIIGVFVTKNEPENCGNDNAYFTIENSWFLENELGSSSIRAIKIEPCVDEIIEDAIIMSNKNVKASIRIIGSSKIDNVPVNFSAGTEVILDNGFESGNEFVAEIKPCVSQVTALAKTDVEDVFVSEDQVEERIINNKDVSAYPTVIVNNHITLESIGMQQIQFFLTDIQGKILLKDKILTDGGEFSTKLELPYLNSGIYLLHISDGQFSKTIKLIKE